MGTMIQLDGAQGEGGGQILRTALSLSMLSGLPLRIERIRAGRKKPGLMRQHLTCVRAAAQVCSADVGGAEIGSTALEFRPGPVRAGEYRFAIGSAGSTMLVLQTVLPALLRTDGESRLVLEGGTHNPLAPSADFIADSFLPVLRQHGARIEFSLDRHGFFPAGGGAVTVNIAPAPLRPIELLERGDPGPLEAEAMVSNLPGSIVERELAAVRAALPRVKASQRFLPPGIGPGNALLLRARFAQITEIITELGAVGVSSETVAERAVAALKSYLAHGAPVGEHLADQLLLPMLVAGGGSFVTGRPSTHLETNASVIEASGLAQIDLRPDDGDPQRRWRVSLRANPCPAW